jgi:hypothetical protein
MIDGGDLRLIYPGSFAQLCLRLGMHCGDPVLRSTGCLDFVTRVSGWSFSQGWQASSLACIRRVTRLTWPWAQGSNLHLEEANHNPTMCLVVGSWMVGTQVFLHVWRIESSVIRFNSQALLAGLAKAPSIINPALVIPLQFYDW